MTVNENAVWHFVCGACRRLHHATPREVQGRRGADGLTCFIACPACGHEHTMRRVPGPVRRRIEASLAEHAG